MKMPAGVPAGLARVVEHDFSLISGGKSYVFSTEDRSSEVLLTKDGLTISSRNYARWEIFQTYIQKALESLDKLYKPSFFNHVCVRYKNSIRPSSLELVGTPWSELLQPWVSGLFDKVETASSIVAMQNRCRVTLPDLSGIVEAAFSLGAHQPSKEPAFIIEAHVFHEARKELKDVLPRLDDLHRHAGNFFRWCITDKLHRSLRPHSV